MNEIVSENAGATGDPIEQAPYFFTSSVLKLVLMSVCTFGIYDLYWFYKNWVLIKERTNQDLMPFWRAFFAPLWAYGCFKHIKSIAEERKISISLPIGFLAIAYFVLQALWKLPDPYWLLSTFSFIPIIPVNAMALAINQNVGARNSENSVFSTWNWVGLVGGGLLFVLATIGTLLSKT